ncbi:MAG: hypothetical protein K8Q88_00060 [Nitrosarchaeum sp.]|nr:hypothetical protein [Nitrosarchaeum sp.]
MLIIIEVEYYESNFLSQLLNELSYAENPTQKNSFWDNATKYAASTNGDESFVSEIAYMMVTLHRTGA